MKLKITLSKKEKKHYFIYLLAMLLFGVVFLSIVFLNKLDSPFNNSETLAIKTLQQKEVFNERQKIVQPIMDSTFLKIRKLPIDKQQPVEENELNYAINDLKDAFSDLSITDGRKENYFLIAKFYKMYFDDKKIMVKKNENLKIFTKQFDDCMMGTKEMQQKINMRKNAQIMGRRN